MKILPSKQVLLDIAQNIRDTPQVIRQQWQSVYRLVEEGEEFN